MALEILQSVKNNRKRHQKSNFKYWNSSSRNVNGIYFILVLSFTLQAAQLGSRQLTFLSSRRLSVAPNTLRKFVPCNLQNRK